MSTYYIVRYSFGNRLTRQEMRFMLRDDAIREAKTLQDLGKERVDTWRDVQVIKCVETEEQF